MKAIWKYEINDGYNPIVIRVPRNSVPLCVQMQYNKPNIWFLVNTNEAGENIKFYVYGTGMEIMEENISYIGTFQLDWMVLHVFMETK